MIIEQAGLFQGMPAGLQEKIRQLGVEESFREGDLVFEVGERAQFFYILEEGTVRLTVGGKGRVAYTVDEEGDHLGWSSLVEREAYIAAARCLTPTRLFKIQRETLDRILEEDPASGLIFYKRVAAILGKRLVGAYQMLLSAYGEKGPFSYG